MEKVGLKSTTVDPCLFYGTHENSFLCVAIYVDERLVVCNKDAEIEVFLGRLQEEFKVKIGSLETYSECRLNVRVMGRSL
jgi:hypothetical protein